MQVNGAEPSSVWVQEGRGAGSGTGLAFSDPPVLSSQSLWYADAAFFAAVLTTVSGCPQPWGSVETRGPHTALADAVPPALPLVGSRPQPQAGNLATAHVGQPLL